MPSVLVDSNVLLDLVTQNHPWFDWSADAITKAANGARLVINAIIYAEISVRYPRIEELDAAFPASLFEREAIPFEAGFLRARLF